MSIALPPRRRRIVALACNSCRQKKIACDALRPTCTPCTHRGIACVYAHDLQDGETRPQAQRREAELKGSRLDEIENAFRWLKTLPNHEAMTLLQDVLRSDDGPLDALTSLASGTPRTIEPAVGSGASTVLPSRRLSLRYELCQLHPNSYPTLIPLERWVHSPANLVAPQLVESSLAINPEQLVLPSSNSPRSYGLSHTHGSRSSLLRDSSNPGVTPRMAPANPNNPQPLSDVRLNHLTISNWTQVPISDAYAANVISRYLTTDHPILGFFDADLFVQDLVNGRTEFCSPLLVSTVLYWGCQMYSTVDPQSSLWSFRFLAEAKQRWAQERDQRSILAVAAGYLLSLGLKCYCNDSLSSKFMEQTTRLASELRLFGVTKSEEERESDQQMPYFKHRAIAHVAWGAYCWLALMAHYYGSDVTTITPSFPIPGELNTQQRADGLTPSSAPAYNGLTFTAHCQLRRIHTKALVAYNTREQQGPLLNRLNLQFAEDIYKEMLQWADNLEEGQLRGQYAPNHVLLLHMWYHAMVLQLFRPFLGHKLYLRSFTAYDSMPETVFNASLDQLKALAVTYHRLQPSATYTILWHISLLNIGSSVLSATGHPDWHYFFILCINAYQDLSKCFRVAAGFLQGLLWLATRSGLISAKDSASILEQFFRDHDQNQDLRALRSNHKVDLELAARDIDAALDVTAAVEKLEELSITANAWNTQPIQYET